MDRSPYRRLLHEVPLRRAYHNDQRSLYKPSPPPYTPSTLSTDIPPFIRAVLDELQVPLDASLKGNLPDPVYLRIWEKNGHRFEAISISRGLQKCGRY